MLRAELCVRLAILAKSKDKLPSLVDNALRRTLCEGDLVCKQKALSLVKTVLAFEPSMLSDRVFDLLRVHHSAPKVLQLQMVEVSVACYFRCGKSFKNLAAMLHAPDSEVNLHCLKAISQLVGKTQPAHDQHKLTLILLSLLKTASSEIQSHALQILSQLQAHNKSVLLECVKQVVQNPAATNASKSMIVSMLVQRVPELPTLSLETLRRLL